MTAIVVVITAAVALCCYFAIGHWLTWYGIELPFTGSHDYKTVADAVAGGTYEDVARLIQEGADVNAPDYRGKSPLLIATGSDQYQEAELLIEHGANIWIASKLGFTAGNLTYETQQLGGKFSDPQNEIAFRHVIELLKAGGYPWPPPDAKAVVQLQKEGKWPPLSATNNASSTIPRAE